MPPVWARCCAYYSATQAAQHINWPDVAVLVSAAIVLMGLAHHWLRNRDLA